MIKNKRFDLFISLSIVVLLFLSLWVCFPMGTIFSKITLLYMTTEVRVQVEIGFLTVILFVYILSNYEVDDNNKINLKEMLRRINDRYSDLTIEEYKEILDIKESNYRRLTR